MLLFHNRLEQGVVAGVIYATGVDPQAAVDSLGPALAAAHKSVASELAPDAEARRLASRDMLRNGRYKPTGRGKPANEYLLRASRDGSFPAINAVVDALNLVSLKSMVPISVCDLALAGGHEFSLRLGREGETYVFNTAGQILGLHDLVVGCLTEDGQDRPLVTPIKDGMASKIQAESSEIAAIIYHPANVGGAAGARAVTEELVGWYRQLGAGVRIAHAVAEPGTSATLQAE